MSKSNLPKSLDEMLEISNARAVYQHQVRMAEIKFRNACILGFAGGEFHIDPYLLGYLEHRVRVNVDKAVVLDVNNLPILITDLEDFLDIASSQYHSALNEYYDEVQRLRSTRDPAKMVEAKE